MHAPTHAHMHTCTQVAAAIQEQEEKVIEPGGVWDQVKGNMNGEQLAYVAALATGAELVFGDRPKNITFA